MIKRTALLVTGSRDWRDWQAIQARLIRCPVGTILIHGDCGHYEESSNPEITAPVVVGADKMAATYGRSRGFTIWPLPYFGDLGKRGGPERNDTMIDVLSALWKRGFKCTIEGFPIGRSPGTRGCLFAVGARQRLLGSDWVVTVTEGRP